MILNYVIGGYHCMLAGGVVASVVAVAMLAGGVVASVDTVVRVWSLKASLMSSSCVLVWVVWV